MKSLVSLLAFLAFLALYPLAIIWAVNTLFHLGIAYSIVTVLAVIVLSSVFAVSRSSR